MNGSGKFTPTFHQLHMRQPFLILIGSIVVGAAGGAILRDTPSEIQAVGPTADWTPRNTIQHEPLMTAADLDRQQPDTLAFAAGRRRIPSGMAPPANPEASWSYRNCAAARAAGAAPLYRGQPGYGSHMDGDNDGIACEPFRR